MEDFTDYSEPAVDIASIPFIKKIHYDKWERLREAEKVFKQLDIKFDSHNQHLHWIFQHNDQEINYWATTGKWWNSTTNHRATEEERYLSGLLTHLNYDFLEVD